MQKESNIATEHAHPSGRGGPDHRHRARPGLQRALAAISVRRISAVYLWLGFMILFGLLSPETFLTSTTYNVVLSNGVVTCVLALAFLIPLTCGQYDLSIGGVMALSLALMVYLSVHSSLAPGLIAVIAVASCTAVGAISGFIIVRLRVNSFIATLGMSQVLLAGVVLISDNTQIVGQFSEAWKSAGNDTFLGIPIVLYYLLAVAAVIWYVLEYTRPGRYLFATGGNEEAARLSGVRTSRVIWLSLVASGALAGLAGVIASMRSPIFTSSIGPGYLFPAIAAVFLGASQLSQRPNVWGTLIAYFALAFGVQGILLSASDAGVWAQPLFQGVSLIVAVSLAARPALKKLKTDRRASVSPGADTGSDPAGGPP
ncbi:MAG TPA: ABC transporter permease [Solirubrobacterales bacterium]|nr:ABC transporter permease [Solirubrobacterales bacterium]